MSEPKLGKAVNSDNVRQDIHLNVVIVAEQPQANVENPYDTHMKEAGQLGFTVHTEEEPPKLVALDSIVGALLQTTIQMSKDGKLKDAKDILLRDGKTLRAIGSILALASIHDDRINAVKITDFSPDEINVMVEEATNLFSQEELSAAMGAPAERKSERMEQLEKMGGKRHQLVPMNYDIMIGDMIDGRPHVMLAQPLRGDGTRHAMPISVIIEEVREALTEFSNKCEREPQMRDIFVSAANGVAESSRNLQQTVELLTSHEEHRPN